jgi:Leucine-rich repeat (LRR) protein
MLGCRPRRGASLVAIVVPLAILAAVIGIWMWTASQSSQRELAAKQELAQLGALAVMDAQGAHVASINLSSMPPESSLERAVELLTSFPQLRSLDASRTRIGDEHAATMGLLDSLNTLTLNDTQLTDQGLAHLSNLANLEALNLALTKITDAGLPSFASMKTLKVLDLSGTQVANQLAPLAKLPSLTWLALRNCKLGDSALDGLSDSPSLQRLSLEDTQVAPESVQRLTQQNPQLRVATGSSAAPPEPTDEGPTDDQPTNDQPTDDQPTQ